MIKEKLPNFLIVGAAKSGTTSIFIYLKQHPEIFLPDTRYKEPRFFIASKYINLIENNKHFYEKFRIYNFNDYKSLFDEVNNEKAIGEATTSYLYFYDLAIPQIKKYLDDPKIIIFLRNPIDRAYSSYKHLIRDRSEYLSFEKCLKLEQKRKTDSWPVLFMLKDAGLYYHQVKAYLENFSNVKFIFYDDLIKNQNNELKKLLEFLEVNTEFKFNTQKKHNIGKLYKFNFLNKLLKNKNPLKDFISPILSKTIGNKMTGELYNKIDKLNTSNAKMKSETRKELIDFFKKDIMKLEKLINKDLSHWLKH